MGAGPSAGQRLMTVLEDRRWYSYGTQALCSKLDCPRDCLLGLAGYMEGETGKQINVFEYGGVEYMGLEERRLDYERDKQNGTNWVENAMARKAHRRQAMRRPAHKSS